MNAVTGDKGVERETFPPGLPPFMEPTVATKGARIVIKFSRHFAGPAVNASTGAVNYDTADIKVEVYDSIPRTRIELFLSVQTARGMEAQILGFGKEASRAYPAYATDETEADPPPPPPPRPL